MIEVENLSKRYGDKLAVDGLDFVVRPGIVTGFLGPNGAGKSTTMRMIAGLDEPTAGRVKVNGRDYRAARPRWPSWASCWRPGRCTPAGQPAATFPASGPGRGTGYRVGRNGELYLCGHCSSRLWQALSAQGWTLWPIGNDALALQGLPPTDYNQRGTRVTFISRRDC